MPTTRRDDRSTSRWAAVRCEARTDRGRGVPLLRGGIARAYASAPVRGSYPGQREQAQPVAFPGVAVRLRDRSPNPRTVVGELDDRCVIGAARHWLGRRLDRLRPRAQVV